MSTYILGDVHGCFNEMQLILEQAKFNKEQDQLYLVGDLIARGDDSLACLNFVKGLGDSAHMVLGNHELHFLATAYQLQQIKPEDKVDTIFSSPIFKQLVDWLRHQPLLIKHPTYNFLISHAGISPDWSEQLALDCSKEVENVLQNGDFIGLLTNMYGKYPTKWSPELQGIERFRYTINSLTRMRYCYADGTLDFDCKKPVNQADENLKPWFLFNNEVYKNNQIVFGHWASLIGTKTPSYIYALDSGCVWGNYLTLLRWEDKQYFFQPKIK